jgi:6-phosphogluconolactonase (cycloisomerase 2 family)
MTTSGVPDAPVPAQELFIAGHGAGPEFGLYRFRVRDGGWDGAQLARVDALSALARHPRAPIVYGVSGTPEDGWLHAWRIDGPAEPLAEVPTGGGEPCHLAVDPAGRWLVVANYAGSSLAVWLLADDGSLLGDPHLIPLVGTSVDPERQEAAHPHQVVLDGDLAYAVDLGADVVRVFAVQASSDAEDVLTHLRDVAVPAGTGPRHLVTLGDDLVALSGELLSTVLTGRLDGSGLDWSATPSTGRGARPAPPYERNYPSDIARSSDRRLVYLANRGHDTVSTFDVGSGEPVVVGEVDVGGRWPQHFLVQGEDLLVAARDSNRVTALALEDGVPTTSRVLLECPGATWLLPAAAAHDAP